MPRIPYIFPPRGESGIADSIRSRRTEEKLTDLDGMILNAPKFAEGYNILLKAVRTSSSLPDDIRELMVCDQLRCDSWSNRSTRPQILRVAALNSAAYEWVQHEPLARRAGLSSLQLAIIRDVSVITRTSAFDPGTSCLSSLQTAALNYTDFMTRSIAVPQEVFDALRANLENDQQIFEATATIATYNMVSRMLVALDVGDKAGEEVSRPHEEDHL
ncbi:carboxymuconolactone decarboxylase [Phellopilus nigrolimitatus]|nr:carboxymuconolactone decarboxylase [Phellopilus nigrolimitatus]